MGWSYGGVLAFEIAKQLTRQGEYIKDLILVDSFFNYKKADIILNNTEEYADDINYRYSPTVENLDFFGKVVLFKAMKIEDFNNAFDEEGNLITQSDYDIYKYFAHNTSSNHLNEILPENKYKVIYMDSSHGSWINDQAILNEIHLELKKGCGSWVKSGSNYKLGTNPP